LNHKTPARIITARPDGKRRAANRRQRGLKNNQIKEPFVHTKQAVLFVPIHSRNAAKILKAGDYVLLKVIKCTYILKKSPRNRRFL
jgi:hypothetical protein